VIQPTIPLTALLIKPAGPDCNLACEYCFYLEKADLFQETRRHRMTDRILKETLKQALSQCGQGISLSWQGGEPTLMGLDFYKQSIKHEKAFGRGKTVNNALQTNGVLLNTKWAKFLKKYNFLVGLSIDGPKHIHDRYRQSPKGKGSWNTVHAKIKKLIHQGVSVNAMTCLSDYSVQYPDVIYQFHKISGLNYMQFIPIVEWDAQGAMAPFSVSADQYGKFMCRIFDLWLQDFKRGNPTTSIRLFESLFFNCLRHTSPQCTFQDQCGQYLVVEHNGDVYPCDFYVDRKWKLGNVMTHDLTAMLNSEKQATFRRMKTAPDACEACQYRDFCHGGCTKHRGFGGQPGKKTFFCTAYMRIFDHALPRLKTMAGQWRPSAG